MTNHLLLLPLLIACAIAWIIGFMLGVTGLVVLPADIQAGEWYEYYV